jgi:restriction system protein
MTRRGSRRRSSSGGGALGAFVLLLALLALGGVIVRVFEVLIPFLAVGTIGLIAWRVRDRRKQQCELAEAERIHLIRSREVAAYHQMNPREFEEALAYLCRRDGCLDAQATGRAGDFGADVIALTPDGYKLVIQAKRYASGNLVTGPDLQKFAGTCRTIHQANIAAVVTTSSFTRQAREMAMRAGILWFDAEALGGWASQTGPPPWAMALSASGPFSGLAT